ncbi:MAG: hypothetical protein ACJ0SL_00355 [Candidatus Rariloculaceae bacterium]
MEYSGGVNCFGVTPCVTAGLVDPIHEYGRRDGASVTGGYVYRGANVPLLGSLYVFADFISSRIWAIDSAAQSLTDSTLLLESGLSIASFSRSNAGELFVVDFSGSLFEIIVSD